MFIAHTAVFSALSDPTRLSIVEQLAQHGSMTAGDIYSRFKSSASAVSQHLKTLREARVVTVKTRAQQRIYELNPQTIAQAEEWLQSQTLLWNNRLDNLDAYVKTIKK